MGTIGKKDESQEGGIEVLSAIVVVGPQTREEESGAAAGEAAATAARAESPIQEGTPLVCVEILGRSVIARLIDDLRRASVEQIAILGNHSGTPGIASIDSAAKLDLGSAEPGSPQLGSPEKVAEEITRQVLTFKESGVEAILIVRVCAYADMDLKDAFQFHREQGQVVTRAFDKDGPLDLWVIDPAWISEDMDTLATLRAAEPTRYFVRGYVNRLEHPRDLRRLVVDGLSSRCGLRPQGTEIRPGVWMEEGAQVHRDARIVAPAFIGREARIEEQCLITRCSNIESNSHVDYGTVVEDSTILPNSYVGIGLDLSHSIVDGNNLLNLERGVTVEISDPCVIRQTRVSHPERILQAPVAFGLASAQLPPVEEGLR
jgi:NDP-sugar pyrophosphorylase family protein